MELPQQMLIRRYNNEDSLLYALINLHGGTELTFTVEKRYSPDPVFYKRAVWKPQQLIRTACVRYGREKKEYISDFMYTGFIASVDGRDIEIWEVNNPYKILPVEFMFLNKYEEYSYVILQGERALEADAPTLVPPPRGLNTLQKKLAAFCESNTDSCCPITLEPFNSRTVCLTPCGHGIKYSAMLEWLASREQCPMCRATCRADDLIKW